MLYRTLTIVGFTTVLAAGCRNNGQTPVDLSSGSSDMATGGDMAKNYVNSDIKTMRNGASGDFSLANVIALAVSPSGSSSPRLVVQDASGGDFSAILSRCSPTSTAHPCTVASTVIAPARSTTCTSWWLPRVAAPTVTGSSPTRARTRAASLSASKQRPPNGAIAIGTVSARAPAAVARSRSATQTRMLVRYHRRDVLDFFADKKL